MGQSGWRNLDEVWIPPIEAEGFQEEVVIRKRIEPAPVRVTPEPAIAEEVKMEPVSLDIEEEPAELSPEIIKEEPVEQAPVFVEEENEVYDGEDATVLLSDDDEYDGEDATVLLTQEVVFTAYVERKCTGEKVCIDKDRFIIGKSSSADFVIKNDKTISRKHVAINRTADGYYLEDLGSSNHTFVDGLPITEPVKLYHNTVFQLSKEEFEFTLV